MTGTEANKVGVTPDERTAIGITFGNSYSSIAVTVDDSAVVIANEDGGKLDTRTFPLYDPIITNGLYNRPTNSHLLVLR